MEHCLFCKIVARQIPAEIVHETEEVLAFLDINPVSKGHVLIIPKHHAVNLTEGSVEDAVALMRAVHAMGGRVMKALGATGYNLGMNHGEDAGQEVLHTHVHVMPRYAGDARMFIKMHPSKEELREVADLIRDTSL